MYILNFDDTDEGRNLLRDRINKRRIMHQLQIDKEMEIHMERIKQELKDNTQIEQNVIEIIVNLTKYEKIEDEYTQNYGYMYEGKIIGKVIGKKQICYTNIENFL